MYIKVASVKKDVMLCDHIVNDRRIQGVRVWVGEGFVLPLIHTRKIFEKNNPVIRKSINTMGRKLIRPSYSYFVELNVIRRSQIEACMSGL